MFLYIKQLQSITIKASGRFDTVSKEDYPSKSITSEEFSILTSVTPEEGKEY